ncbi:MAG: phage/plasmid primase, P4 family [Eubacteriales bacterium]|nr:phage/plasmid primase, P4 family [Eubacteriales bacterium]
MAETKLHPGIPVTYEFENFIPPEEDGVIFEEPARQWQTTAPDVASMFDDEKQGGILDKDRREAFVRAGQASTSRRAVSDEAGASSGKTFNPPDDWYTAEPEVVYTMRDEDKEKREAFLKSQPDPNLGRPKVSTGRPVGQKNLSRRTMSDVAGASSGAERNLDSATGGSPEPAPVWWNGKSINTTVFCQEYLKTHELRCINGTFFTPDGYCPAQNIRAEVYDMIKHHVCSYPAQTASNIVENLKIEARADELLVDEDLINFANGTLNISDSSWTEEKLFCRNRLPVVYTGDDAKVPENWMRFVNELLEPYDVDTLQEYMGYCMISSTAAQKMLLIIGNGGEGKSRIGVVMKEILGDNMNSGSIPKLETNSFAKADLEHKLLMVDDDMRIEQLPTTNSLKAVITAEGLMDLEKKGQQSYQGLMYCRLMAFSNGYLKSANDDSYGFFRRQLILMTKPRPKDRIDDPFLSKKLRAERDQIAMWALRGLYRLKRNNFRFTVSDRSKAAIMSAMDEANNVVSFLRSKGSFTFDPEGEITSREFYNIYKCWCDDNAVEATDKKRVISYLRAHCHEYGLTYAQVHCGYKYVRGFRGMKPGMATPINPVMSA